MVRLLFRLLPWWGFVLIGLFLAPITALMIGDCLAVRTARDLPPPAPVPIESFDPARDALDSGEAGLAVWLSLDLGLLAEGELGDPRHVTLPLYGPQRQTVLGIGRVAYDRAVELREYLTDRQSPGGGIVLYGWHEADPDWANPVELGRAAQRPVSADPIYLDLFLGDRDAAYEDKALTLAIGSAILAIATVGALLLGRARFRRWRQRRGAQRSAPASPQVPVATTPVPEPPREKPLPNRSSITSPWDSRPPSVPEPERTVEASPTPSEPPPPVPPSAQWKKTPEEIVARAFRKPVRRP